MSYILVTIKELNINEIVSEKREESEQSVMRPMKKGYYWTIFEAWKKLFKEKNKSKLAELNPSERAEVYKRFYNAFHKKYVHA
ncbi:hypothetical protein KGV55_02785 [Candidatus Gracilibacteria bacterium]|nr:hypothetical protein [Candidatus Gracilibacteria bacterium]